MSIKYSKKYNCALITGASVGIGKAITEEISKVTQSVILVARRPELLEQLETGACKKHIFACDLESPSARKKLLADISSLEVDLLINNAGFGRFGAFADGETENELSMVELNCKALLELTLHFSKIMVPGSRIVNLASVAAFQPMPFMATYAATKAFVVSLSAAVDLELRRKDIRCISVCPGPTKSDFHLRSGLSEKINLLPSMTAEEVAREVLEVILSPRPILVNGKLNLALSTLAKILPTVTSGKIVKFLLERQP